MHHYQFDSLTRLLASTDDRRSLLKRVAVAAIGGSLAAARAHDSLAQSTAKKVEICIWDGDIQEYVPKYLPPPAANTFVDHGKAFYPIQTSDIGCDRPCGPQCLSCGQIPPYSYCTKCVDGACTCAPSTFGAVSTQGGAAPTTWTPLLGTTYQVYSADQSTPLTGVKEVTDPEGSVVFDETFPGNAVVCMREVETPVGYTLLGDEWHCLALGCGDRFMVNFSHTP